MFEQVVGIITRHDLTHERLHEIRHKKKAFAKRRNRNNNNNNKKGSVNADFSTTLIELSELDILICISCVMAVLVSSQLCHGTMLSHTISKSMALLGHAYIT